MAGGKRDRTKPQRAARRVSPDPHERHQHTPALRHGRRGFADLRPTAPRTRSEHWRYDLGPRVAANQRIAQQAFLLASGRGSPPPGRLAPELPGFLDQRGAAAARRWHYQEGRGIRAAFQREAKARCQQLYRFRTTVVPPQWQVGEAAFRAAEVAVKVRKWHKQAQRWARRLPPGSFACGVIEADLVDDEQFGRRYWAFHVHLDVLLPGESRQAARETIRRAFRVRNNPRLGVSRAVLSKQYRPRRGGVRGWYRYMTKAFQIHGVHRRVVPFDAEIGRRKRSRKQHLSYRELAPWTALLALLRPDDLMVWVGYRRRGAHVRPV